jgi:Thaumarchaeal output domain 1
MIVLLDETASETISAWRARATDFLLPVVDLSGALATSCDATFSINDPLSWNATAEVIIKFATRRAHLARESQRATDLDTRLMAYLYVADRALSPIGDPASKLFIRYPGFFPADELSAVTDRLMSRGLLRRTFVDRFHSCGSCHAHRLNVREECLYCRSPHLSEVSLLHHFSCAALKPEDAFRSGKNLICPKCRQHLRHYGSDYDKPGTTLQCGSCGASNSDPVVGFSCQDCGAHTDGDAASTTDVHAFDLTDEAIARLTAQGSIEFRGGELPPSLEWELKSLSRDFREPATAIARISYLKREDVVKTRGTAAFLKLRELFIENLRNVVADLGSVVATEEDDYLLLKETDPQELSRLAPLLFEQCEALLAESIGPDFTLIDASGRLAS